jgi:hypothetical protein
VELWKDAWENRGPRPFRYEVMWQRVMTLSEEIKTQWCSNANKDRLSGIVKSLQNMQTAFHRWSKQHFGAVTTQLNWLRSELEVAKANNPADHREIRAIADRMDELLYREENMWLQCSWIS